MNRRYKKFAIAFGVTVFVLGIFIPHNAPALAQDGPIDYATNLLAQLLLIIVSFFGELLTNLTTLLVSVAKYSNFGGEAFVGSAWVVVRDFANIFFILALLLIAIATILRIEVYSARRLLFKLVLMAILINFSRSIAVSIIQIAQIIMLFFIDSFANATGLLVTNLLLISEYLSIAEQADGLANIDLSGLLGTVIFAGILIGVGLFVVGTIIIMLIFRIVFLWILIILSPLAFLLHAVPGGTSYAGQWWSRFTRNVISGPLMAFFLWLAFFAVSPGQGGRSIAQTFAEQGGQLTNALSITSPGNLTQFIVGLGLLIGGLIMTSQLGAAGGSLASSAVSRIQRAGSSTLRTGRRAGVGAVSGLGYASGVTPAAKALRDRTSSIPLARVFTQDGRKQMRLEREASIQRGRIGGYQTNPSAERELEKAYKEGGRLDTPSSRKELARSTRPIERAIGIKAMLASGDDGATDEMYKQFDIAQIGNDQNKLRELQDLEKLAEKEDKLFVGKIKVNKDGAYEVKSAADIQSDKKKKLNNRNENEIGKDIRGFVGKAKKDVLEPTEVNDLAESLASYDLEGQRLEYNRGGQRDLAEAIRSVFEKHGDKLSKTMQQQLERQYAALQKSKIDRFNVPPLPRARGSRSENVSRQFNRLSGVATEENQETITSNMSAVTDYIREAGRGNYEPLRTRGRSDALSTLGVYRTLASENSDRMHSDVINPTTGKEFSMAELVSAQEEKMRKSFDEYDTAVAEFEKASDDKAKAEAKTRIDAAVADLQNDAYVIETPKFSANKASFEARSSERQSLKESFDNNSTTLKNMTANTNLTRDEWEQNLQDTLGTIQSDLFNTKEIYKNTIGMSKEQQELYDNIATATENLNKNPQLRTGDALASLAADIEKLRNSLA